MRSFLFFTSAVCLANCIDDNHLMITRSSSPSSSTANRADLGIYNGKNITIEQFPYVVSIVVYGSIYCAGTIVSDRWIIADGDSVHNVEPSSVKVIAGSDNGRTGDTYKAVKIVQHPKYYQKDMDYDVALIKVDRSIKFSPKVQPAKLPKGPPVKANTTVHVAGYGATGATVSEEATNEANGRLVSGDMFWQSMAFCKKAYKEFGFNLTLRMGCIYNKGKTTLCSGDFGAPAIFEGTLLGWFIAIASPGFCSADAAPAIFGLARPLVHWITATIAGAAAD